MEKNAYVKFTAGTVGVFAILILFTFLPPGIKGFVADCVKFAGSLDWGFYLMLLVFLLVLAAYLFQAVRTGKNK